MFFLQKFSYLFILVIISIISSCYLFGNPRFEDLRKYYEDFDILFIKEALAKVTKILIYHFPALYKDLDFLFENTDKYFD